MSKWLKRVRGAIGMGLTWAAAWALTGILIGVTSVLLPWLPWWDRFFRVFDAPLPALAVPGFVGGVLFSLVLGVAGRRRNFRELSLPRFTAWGAVGGVLLALVPDAMMTVGLASPGPEPLYAPWEFAATIAPFLTVLCAASAAGSLVLARRAEGGAVREADPAVGGADMIEARGLEDGTADAALSRDDTGALPGGRAWAPPPSASVEQLARRTPPPAP